MKKLIFLLVPMILSLAVVNGGEAGQEKSGQNLYKTYCWQCHGMTGDGKGLNILDMSVQPRDHTDKKEMSGRSDEVLFKAIKEGGQGISKSVLMPPWAGVLSDEEIHELVRYLRTLCDCKFGQGG